MKKRILLFSAMILGAVSFAQAPQKMSYQSVVRDNTNVLVTSAPVGVRVSILQGSASGTPVYVETHAISTNANGLATLAIGAGTVVSGTMASINWAAGPYFVKTETDPTGGTSYTITGTSEIMSSPYALYAANSAAGPTGPAGAPGAPGPAGAPGTNGTNGLNGTNGTNGAVGPTGPAGAAGANGSAGANGATGATGANGSAGANGATGATGANGTNGTNGADGATGAAGANGATGATGANGSNGATGATGAAGADGATGATGATGVTGATGPGTLTGTTNYIIKFTSATGGGNSLMQDNGTSISAGLTTPSVIYQFYVYRQQLTINGDGQSSLFGYRTRDSQNDGISYAQISANDATRGYNFWGDVYTFGVGGWNYNDYSRCGGTYGGDVNGLQWGSLGYRSSGLLNYGVYGNAAYATGGGFAANNLDAGIGGGFFGMVGTMTKGNVIGQLNKGGLFASYNIGDVYTSGKNVELISNGTEMTPAYAVTSTEAVIYKKGRAQMVNGTATIAFDSNYSRLLGESPVVTITPMGQCNGVYIESVTKDGFTIKELNAGNSSVEISWIAVGDRVDAKSTEVPSFIKDKSFDQNIDKVLFNDGDKTHSGEGMWWDGTTLQLNKNYPREINPTREDKTRMLEAEAAKSGKK
jgi:hypothetical protein